MQNTIYSASCSLNCSCSSAVVSQIEQAYSLYAVG